MVSFACSRIGLTIFFYLSERSPTDSSSVIPWACPLNCLYDNRMTEQPPPLKIGIRLSKIHIFVDFSIELLKMGKKNPHRRFFSTVWII